MACRGCIEAHHPMAITPLVVAAPSPLDHERTASIHCAATRENTECATRASRATVNADGHHATARARGFARGLTGDDPDRDHGIFNATLSIPMVGLVGVGEGTWVWGSG